MTSLPGNCARIFSPRFSSRTSPGLYRDGLHALGSHPDQPVVTVLAHEAVCLRWIQRGDQLACVLAHEVAQFLVEYPHAQSVDGGRQYCVLVRQAIRRRSRPYLSTFALLVGGC